VEDLFILAQQPLDRPIIAKMPVKLDRVIEECGRAAQVLAAQKHLKLTIAAKAPWSVQGDDELLQRMILNLLDNAFKYTPAGGEVSIELTASNGDVLIRVRDNGIGIPIKDQPFVFNRFFRVDKARSRAMGGAGLGLSIVRRIAEAHGGSVSLESGASGSIFTVELPIAMRPAPPVVAEAPVIEE
jgi:signal transduction histidine kinase